MKRRIDFVLAGVQKSGTTSLYAYLRQHPDIFLPDAKELPYFLDEDAYRLGEPFLRPFYSSVSKERVIGLCHVHVLSFPETARRIHDYNPAMKLMAVLRNPVDRAYSAYWHARRHGWEDCATFEAALEREAERRQGSHRARAHFGYVAHGHYAEHLQAFFAVLPRSNVRIILTEDLRQHGHMVIRDTFDWLGVSTDVLVNVEHRKNVAARPRIKWLQKAIKAHDSVLKRIYYWLIPKEARRRIRYGLMDRIVQANLKEMRYPPMKAETRANLVEHFRPHNERLAGLIGRPLDHWNK